MLVDKGKYFGFGFVDRKAPINGFEAARNFVKPGVETPTVQNLINSYMLNPRGAEVKRSGRK